MKKELNIAAILRDKPVGTKLWSPIFGDCKLSHLTDNGIRVIPVYNGYTSKEEKSFFNSGKYTLAGEICLFPSKQMQDWSRFAWKKGDVLTDNTSTICMFDSWANEDYTEFNAKYTLHLIASTNVENEVCKTTDFVPVLKDDYKQSYLATAETYFNVNLTKGSLEIEQTKQEFKDGDIVSIVEYDFDTEKARNICIYKNIADNHLINYAFLNCFNRINKGISIDLTSSKLRLATDSEKQQLFDALAKENKRWNPDTKQIEDLPKKCEFKVMDYILIRANRKWDLYQFSYESSTHVHVVGMQQGFGKSKFEILPYNEETKYLLGTTDEWKGGEK